MASKTKAEVRPEPERDDDEHVVDRAADRQIAGAWEEGVAVMVRETGVGPEGPIREAIFVPAGIKKLGEEGFDLMVSMQGIMRTIGQCYEDLRETVDQARQAGMSWEAIGFCTGYTATGARKRWGTEPGDVEPY